MTDLDPIARGDTIILTVALRQPAGSSTPYPDPAHVTLWCTLKRDPADGDAAAVWQGSTADEAIALVDVPDARFEITIPASATTGLAAPTSLYWDVQLQEFDETITTIDRGSFTLFADVTRLAIGTGAVTLRHVLLAGVGTAS